eukprot:3274659-Amphidinium_carterae.1
MSSYSRACGIIAALVIARIASVEHYYGGSAHPTMEASLENLVDTYCNCSFLQLWTNGLHSKKGKDPLSVTSSAQPKTVA